MNILFLYKNFSRFFYKTIALFSRTVQILPALVLAIELSFEIMATFISRGEVSIDIKTSKEKFKGYNLISSNDWQDFL